MASPSAILLLRLMTVGEAVNLWGGYLNISLQTLEQASKGYQSLAVTGDATITWTNYATGNTGQYARLKLTGSPAASSTLTFPAYQNFLSVQNSSTQTITIKCSGGTGVSIPANQTAIIYCDGTDYYNAAATIGPTQSQSTNTYAFVQYGAMQTAIATAALPATSGTLLNSATDTTAGYHASKHTVTYSSATTTQLSGLLSAQFSTSSAGGDERLALTLAPGYVGGFLPGGIQTSQFTPVVGREYTCNLTSSSWTVNLSGMTTPQLEQKIKLNCYGNYPAFLLGTVNGQTNLVLDAGFSGELTYTGASWGWN